MANLLLENIYLEINKTQIVTKASLSATGLCSLSLDPNCGILKDFFFLFSKIHMYSANEIKINGTVYFDGKKLPASKFHHLLNQFVIFEGNENINDVLTLINKEEARLIIDRLKINFTNKKLKNLNVQESRLFEIAVNLASKPPVIFVKTYGMTRENIKRALWALKELIAIENNVVIVESEFNELFDTAIAVRHEEILCLDKEQATRFYMNMDLSIFDIYPQESHIKNNTGSFLEAPQYDYNRIFEKYNTNRLVDLKHKNVPFLTRIATLDFYKINLRQAIHLGFKRYEMTFQKNVKKQGLVRSIFPTVFIILILKIFNETGGVSLEDWMILISSICEVFLNRNMKYSTGIFFFIRFFIKEFSFSRFKILFYNFFRGEIPKYGYRLIFSSVCFSIMYQYSSILEEDSQALNHNINIILTPGTYIASIFIFSFLSHMTTFCFLGVLFNIQLMVINTIGIFFINLLFFPIIGKRLKAVITAFFTTSYLFNIFMDPEETFSKMTMGMLYIVFPSLYCVEKYTNDTRYYPGLSYYLFYHILYCIVVYVISCYHLSFI